VSGKLMVQAVFVFLSFTFIYTVLWFTLTPAVSAVIAVWNQFSHAGWSTQAVTTFNLVVTIFSNTWVWVGALSVLSTIIWIYIFPYREEVDTYAIA
jgi:hypothetical protein